MTLATEREKYIHQVSDLQKKIGEIDKRLNVLYEETYTDTSTSMYVPDAFSHDILATNSPSILREIAKGTRSARTSRNSKK